MRLDVASRRLDAGGRVAQTVGVKPQVCPRHCTLCPIAQVIRQFCISFQGSPRNGLVGKAANFCGASARSEGNRAMVVFSLPRSLPLGDLISWTLWKRRCYFQSSSENGYDDDSVWRAALRW